MTAARVKAITTPTRRIWRATTITINKSANLDDTWMNVTGVAVTSGGLYTYIDYVMARNQPFVGGSMGSNGSGTKHRFNINFGYYFLTLAGSVDRLGVS